MCQVMINASSLSENGGRLDQIYITNKGNLFEHIQQDS